MRKRSSSRLWVLSLILTLVITSMPSGVMADSQAIIQQTTAGQQKNLNQLPTPEQPQKPGQPPTPEQPQKPGQPPTPEQSQKPEQPPTPEQPQNPEQPPIPEQPQKPEQPPIPEQPQKPEQSPTPEQPQKPEQSPTLDQPKDPDQSKNPVVSPSAISTTNLLNADNTPVDIKIISNVNITKLEIIDSKQAIIQTLTDDFSDFVDAKCPKGDYTYKAYRYSQVWGIGKFTVTENGQRIYLSYIHISNASLGDNRNIPVTITLTDHNNNVIEPGRVVPDDPTKVTTLADYVVPALSDKNGSNPYYLKVEVSDPHYFVILSKPSEINLQKGTEWTFDDNSFSVNFTVKEKKNVTFKVPKDANFHLYSNSPAAYVPWEEFTPSSIPSSEGASESYTIPIPSDTNLHYVAGGVGTPYVKQTQQFAVKSSVFDKGSPTYPITLHTKDSLPKADNGYKENNLYLNVPDSNYIRLNTKSDDLANSFDGNASNGNAVNIEGFRVWQPISGETDNQFTEPDYHYEVISGAENIKLTPAGKPGRDQMKVTGLKKGISVIRIAYDPIALLYADNLGTGPDTMPTDVETYWNAIDPENARIVVINVDGSNDANIDTGIRQTEYDTIYYNRDQTDHADFTFTPTADAKIKVRVRDPLKSDSDNWDEKSAWTSYPPGADGSYTVHLKNGRNIIEVSAGASVEYYVVNARALKINRVNGTSPGEPLKVGETEYISFDGLTQPLQKMTAVYNPGFPGTCWVQYQDQDHPDRDPFRSEGVQYNLIDQNTIAVTPTEPGELKLVNGTLHIGWLGSPLNAHRHIPVNGLLPDFNASGSVQLFSTLPDITLPVAPNGEEKENELKKTQFAQLQQIKPTSDIIDDTWDLPNADWDALNGIRNRDFQAVFQEANKNHPKLTLQVEAKNPDGVTIAVSSKKGMNASFESVDKESEQDQLLTYKIDLSNEAPAYTEITVTPKDSENGPIQTYTLRTQVEDKEVPDPYLSNVTVIPKAEGAEDAMNYLDGQLKAVTENGEDLKLGYGFLPTRTHFTTTVPNLVDQITVKADVPEASKAETLNLTVPGNVNEQGNRQAGADKQSAVDTKDNLGVQGISNVQNSSTSSSGDAQNTSAAKVNANGAQALTNGQESKAIPLKVGDNILQLTATLEGATPITYTITVKRQAPAQTVSFKTLEKDSKLVVKSSKGVTKKPVDSGNPDKYQLDIGSYIYYYSRPGYLTQTEPFEVTEQMHDITLPTLSPVDQKDGTITVQITSPNSLLRGKTSIGYTVTGAKDLAAQGYVEYNHGGYTALHAILAACDTGINKIKFSCYQGNLKLSDVVTPSGAGPNAGWVCEINGNVCTDLANTLVKDGDWISYYYNPDYAGMQQASFKQENVSITAGVSASVTLLGAPVNNNGSPAIPIEGATIKLNGQALDGITDADGAMDIPSSKLENPGVYTVTAEKTEGGHNILTYCRMMITVKKADVPVTPGKTTVTFRLIGDAKHGSFATHEKYVTWIATKKYTFNSDSVTVYDVFTKALNDAGLAYVGAEKNYVSKIQAPKAYGGYWLGEFDNGPNSGWMYTVNGVHPEFGLKDFKVTNGDSIIWHYVDDYKKETSFEGSHPEYENRWLEAEDVNPPTDGTIIDMSHGNSGGDPNAATAMVETEAKTDTNGKASVSISSKDISDALKKALEQADKNKKDLAIVRINVKADSSASTVEAVIAASGWKELQKAGNALLDIVTPVGELKFDHDALEAAAKEMNGQDLSLSITKTDAKALPDNIQNAVRDTVGSRPMYQLSLKSGDQAITGFGTGKVTVTLPYGLQKDEKAEGVCVYHVTEDGTSQLVPDVKYLSQNKTVQFATDHFSWYGIGYSEAKARGLTGIARFTDVSLNDWFAASVSQLVDLGILKGKSDTEFAPQDNVTRAEFAQILYGMAKRDSQTTGSAISGAVIKGEVEKAASAFNDVKADAWYGEGVAWAHDAGIIAGYKNGDGSQSFAPNTRISRQDMAVMLMNYTTRIRKKELPKIKASVEFADQGQISPYAVTAVTLMQRAGVISGKVMADQTMFAPQDHATRAEAAQMVAAYINLK